MTIEEQLADVRRRIAQLQALAHVEAAAEGSRIQRHLDALQQEEASVEAAASSPPDEIEARVGQLKTRLAVAEQAVAADFSDDWATFATAVEAELENWDTYLGRLQTTVATRAWHAREQAETGIGDVRSHRIAVDERLAQARAVAADGRQEQRELVSAARRELEQKADELSAKLS